MAGYSVQDATNGRLGVNAFRKTPTDLVITDLYVPERDGLEVIEAFASDASPRSHCIILDKQNGSQIGHGPDRL